MAGPAQAVRALLNRRLAGSIRAWYSGFAKFRAGCNAVRRSEDDVNAAQQPDVAAPEGPPPPQVAAPPQRSRTL
jgi:hypothetical protein